ncbi:MAG TPA: hypothetical protein VI895_00305 [Bdellovibrionota bacterium]|nr:hypothetical protein [Bdellovibrionota bacterium]
MEPDSSGVFRQRFAFASFCVLVFIVCTLIPALGMIGIIKMKEAIELPIYFFSPLMGMLLVVAILYSLTEKVFISGKTIVQTNIFRKKQIDLTQIANYRHVGLGIKIFSKGDKGKVVTIASIMTNFDEVEDWLRSHKIGDLDATLEEVEVGSAVPEESDGKPRIEKIRCTACRIRWEVGWVENSGAKGVEHTLRCNCGRVMKTVQATEGGAPLMIQQHDWRKTILACLPAFGVGAFFPVLQDQIKIVVAAYLLSWIGSAATFMDKYNRSASAIAGIAIFWGIVVFMVINFGALFGHAVWWWWK